VLADARMGRDCRQTLARLGDSVELLDERLLEWRAMREAAGTVSEFAGSIAPVSEILARLGERHDRGRVRFDVEGDARSSHAEAERLLLLVNQIVEHLGRTAPERRVTVRVDCRSRESLALSVLDPGTDRVDGHLGRSLQGFLRDRAAGEGTDALVSVNLDFARRLAARMGGSISLESAAGEGTRIEIRLPMAPPDEGGRPVPGRRCGGPGPV
jgi:K+-sensing histidine kinase KdpD